MHMTQLLSLESFVARWLAGQLRPCVEGLTLLNNYVTTSPTAVELEVDPLTKLTKAELNAKLLAWSEFEQHIGWCPKCSGTGTSHIH